MIINNNKTFASPQYNIISSNVTAKSEKLKQFTTPNTKINQLIYRSNLVPFLGSDTKSEGKPKHLSNNEQLELFKAAKRSGGMSKEINEKLITTNMRLVYFIVAKYPGAIIDSEELVGIGNYALAKAVSTYNPDIKNQKTGKPIAFNTYACKCIHNEILQELRKAKKYANTAYLEEKISTDTNGNDITLGETLRDEGAKTDDQILDGIIVNNAITETKNDLSIREKQLLKMYLNNSLMSFQQIAEKLGISRSYAAKITKSALKKIRVNL